MSDSLRIPCDQVIARLWEYIDDELAPEHSARVRAHLEACSHCFPQYDFERAYLLFVQRTAAQPVPAHLRKRIFEAILAEEGRRADEAEPDEGASGVRGVLGRFLRRR